MMEQNLTATSLDLMHDIVVPPAVTFWPLAPGWLALVLMLVMYMLHLALKRWAEYRANGYRREALQELETLAENADAGEIERLLILMKRVALQHFGREKVASLADARWWEFVETHSKVKVAQPLRLLSREVLYRPDVKVELEAVEKMRTLTKLWINTHGVSDD
jgi:hypothetical protein